MIAITILTSICIVGLFLIYDNMRLTEQLREKKPGISIDEIDEQFESVDLATHYNQMRALRNCS